MKPVLAWMKANVVSVILLAITVVAMPTMFIIGSSMGKKHRAEVEQDVNRNMREVTGITVEYAVEPITPGAQAFRTRMVPNAATTTAIKHLLEQSGREVEAARERVVNFNMAGKRPLVDGLFPEPSSAIAAPERLDAMAKAWAVSHTPLIERLGGGAPPDAETAMRQLRETAFRAQQDMTGGRTDVPLTPDQQQALTQRLSQERLHLYTNRASRLKFYADADVFGPVAAWTESTAPPIDLAWEWQWRHWVREDVVRAIAKANEHAPSVLNAPVKRVERIVIEPLAGGAGGAPGTDATAEVQRDFSKSITGRVGWPASPNPVYDVRYATVTLLADSRELPRVFDAFAQTNLMTVIDVDIASVDDLSSHVRQGYVYSLEPASIVRVTMRIESLWLRDWTLALAPPSVRTAMTTGGGAGTEGAPGRRPAQQDYPADHSDGDEPTMGGRLR